MWEALMLWQLAAAEIRQRPGRTLLTLLSIVIGVAAVVAVYLTSGTTRRAYEDMERRLNGRAALEIVARNGKPYQQSLVTDMARIPGVAAAVPSLRIYGVLRLPDYNLTIPIMGIDPALDGKVRDYEITEGKFLGENDGVLLEQGFARWIGVSVAGKLQVRVAGFQKPWTPTVVGLLSPRGVAGFNQGGVVFVSLKVAQYLNRRPGEINALSLVLDDAHSEAEVRKAIAARLPDALTVRPTAGRAQLGGEVFENVERGLQFACALMIALAVFVVLNTFQMNLSERRTRLAILRAVGATRRQILQLLLMETLAMGLVGAVLGSLLGLAGAHLLLRAMAQLSLSEPFAIELSLAPFVLAVGLGIAVSLVATYLPARRASRISPIEAMRAASPHESQVASRLTTIGGSALFTFSGLMVWACIRGWIPIVVSIPAGVVFLASFALVIPALVLPLGHLVIRVLSRFLRVESFLAEQQLKVRSGRSGLTTGVLYIAIAAGVGLGTTIINNVHDVRTWKRRTMASDFVVFAAFGDAQTGEGVQMTPATGDEIRKLKGVKSVAAVQNFSIRSNGDVIRVVARDFSAIDDLPLVLAEGQPHEVRRGLAAGEAVLGTVVAERRHLKIGDNLEVQTPQGPRQLRVAGLAVDYSVGGNILYLDTAAAEMLFQVRDPSLFLVHAQPHALGEVERELTALCKREGLMVFSFADVSRFLDEIMSGILAGLWGLLALGYVVAGFGIGNTLMMNVLEQTREIALLRVVGMTQRQARRMILAQAAVIGVVGLGLGVFAGVNTAYIMGLCMQPLLGYSVSFSLSPTLICGSFTMALVIVLAAAWFPAGRAARLDLLLALQYE